MAKKFNLSEVQKATAINPATFMIFGYPKVGKTELYSHLENSFIVDFEEGTKYYDVVGAQVDDLDDLDLLIGQFIDEDPKYKVIVLDTITTLYSEICSQLAVRIYNEEQGKKKPSDWDIRSRLDYGRGYSYMREALGKVIDFFKPYCETLILSGHPADKAFTGDSGALNVKDIDLEGKLKNIVSVKMDAVGLLYRKETNKNYLTFISSEEVIAGTRAKHLSNKEFLVSEMFEDGELVTYWDEILK